jgi:RNA recognition motif-containing protein
MECALTNIFVGNLSYQTTEDDLQSAFSAFGTVERVSIIRDRDSGQSRGFGFVEMPNGEEAEKAIQAMNGREISGRALNVNEARPRDERGGGGGGGRGFGGGGGNRGGGRPGGGGGGGFNRREPRW